LWYGIKDIASAVGPAHEPNSTDAGTSLPPLRKDEFWALKDASFELERGECLGLIGHNGAGKSTLLKILNGLISPTTGTVTMRGRVAALIELNAGFNPILSGRENIYNQAALLGFTRAETRSKFDKIVDFAEIGDFLDMPVQNYSSGMRVRLGFAVAAQMEPDVLIIDEVLAVGDVAFRFKCLNAIGELMKSAAVVFVSHSMPQIFRICNQVMLLNNGNTEFTGTDITQGVSEYLGLAGDGSPTVAGSGEVRVEDCRLVSGGTYVVSGGTLRVPYGADVNFEVRISSDAGIRYVGLQIVLWNEEMLPVVDVMSEGLKAFAVDVPDSRIVDVQAAVKRLELNAGRYTVSIMCNSIDGSRSYCRYDNAATLQVEAGAASGAHILTVGEWSSQPVEASHPLSARPDLRSGNIL
jgi:lipopolysaccharide transport system ATP-binding protein